MTKADVLSDLDSIEVCTSYNTSTGNSVEIPFDLAQPPLEPVYQRMPGWKEDITQITSADQLPKNLKSYIYYLEQALHTPVTYVSVGPDREQTIKM